jgi:uncharacterized protein
LRDSISRVDPTEIYAMPMGERCMLFSPRNMTSAMVNRAAVAAMAAYAACNAVDIPENLWSLWNTLTETPAIPHNSPSAPAKLVIIPTRSCNMRCVYCDFGASGARSSTLDPVLACRLIDNAVEMLSTASQAMLHVHFFGGEPLVARQCVEIVVHYSRMVCVRKGLIPWFELTTNGFFDPTALPLIGDYMDSAVISIDGDELRHDLNRRRVDGSGTYSVIAENILSLSRYPVEINLRACITSQSVDAMKDIASHFCSKFKFDVLCFEMMAPNMSSYAAGLAPPDPCRFAAGFLEAESVAASHDVRVVHGPSELIGPRTTSCPVGEGTWMLTPDGRLTACYLEIERWTNRGLDPVIGHVGPVSGPVVEQRKLDAIASLLDSKPRCARCFCRYTCAGGCHIEQTPPGCSTDYDDRCRATRIITAGRLLRNLEGTAAAESFAGNQPAMRAVAENPDDRMMALASSATLGTS